MQVQQNFLKLHKIKDASIPAVGIESDTAWSTHNHVSSPLQPDECYIMLLELYIVSIQMLCDDGSQQHIALSCCLCMKYELGLMTFKILVSVPIVKN